MRHLPYDEDEARALLPLLRAIGDEVLERHAEIRRLGDEAPGDPALLADWTADLARHRRGLRLAHEELARLGCGLVGRKPLTFRIPRRVALGRRNFLWQGGELLAY